jgi:hypothetical protein
MAMEGWGGRHRVASDAAAFSSFSLARTDNSMGSLAPAKLPMHNGLRDQCFVETTRYSPNRRGPKPVGIACASPVLKSCGLDMDGLVQRTQQPFVVGHVLVGGCMQCGRVTAVCTCVCSSSVGTWRHYGRSLFSTLFLHFSARLGFITGRRINLGHS